MHLLFPPGDISWKNHKNQSVWREFNFAYNQVKRAIEPSFKLEDMISGWNDISNSLAECGRKRKCQLNNYFAMGSAKTT